MVRHESPAYAAGFVVFWGGVERAREDFVWVLKEGAVDVCVIAVGGWGLLGLMGVGRLFGSAGGPPRARCERLRALNQAVSS